MRGVTVLEPVLDEGGNPVVVDGKIITHKNNFKTVMVNWDAWLSLATGIGVIIIGLRNLRNDKFRAEQPLSPR